MPEKRRSCWNAAPGCEQAASYLEGCQQIYNLIYSGPSSAYDNLYKAVSIADKLVADPFFQGLVEPLNGGLFYP